VVTTAEEVESALHRDDQDLYAMAARARERTLDEHTGQVRAKQLLQYFEEALSTRPAKIAQEVA